MNVRTIAKQQITIQTHNGVSIALSGNNANATWIDTDGFDTVAINILNDASTQFACTVLWSADGVNIQGSESLWAANGGAWANTRSSSTATKARYMKVLIVNSDATAAHVFNAWAYLKA